MTQPEFDPVQHELDVARIQLRLARYALFDEVIDYFLDGQCSFDEAVAQYLHDSGDLEAA